MITPSEPPKPGRQVHTVKSVRVTVILVGTLGATYMLSQFLRNSVAVIAPDLARELHLSASEIGVLASVFFFAFAAAQIPLGIALDRYGPKTSMLVCSAIAILGALIFAFATSPGGLIFARILLGLGSSCYLMAPLALYARLYPPHRFASLTGIQIGLGSVGTLIATAPFAFAVAMVGWRASFFGVAVLILLAALAVWLVVRKEDSMPSPAMAETKGVSASLSGLIDAIRTPSAMVVFCMHFVSHSSFVLVIGLWGGPYLTHIYGFDLPARGNMLFVAAATQVVAAFLWGPSDRLFRSYKIPVLAGALTTVTMLLVVAGFGRLPPVLLPVWFVMFGALSSYTPVMIAHGKSLFAPHLVGRGMTLLNMGTMSGVFVMQMLSGFLIDLFPVQNDVYALDAYRLVFGLQAVVLVAASLIYGLKARDPWNDRTAV